MPRSTVPVLFHRMAVPARKALLPLADGLGALTAPARALPDFLICGAQRSGTTSLFRTLCLHPCVTGPTLRKGVHYFDTGYQGGPDRYRAYFPPRARLRARRGRPRVRAVESSPYYLFHPLAAERIARDLPEVRVVVILRDPVERAYSAHAHETARGFETEPFERALELEPERLAGEEERMLADPGYRSYSHQHHGYVARGRYADQLERMEKHLGRDRMHVVDHADLFDGTARALGEVERFLGLPPGPGHAPGRHNARARTSMPEGLRAELAARFADSDARLADWWGRVPSWRA
ncbi:sulfotransferase domain-containing protein [Nocardiopsis dassonvillei]|uniref:sulfotransferase domain-containing protein n=1 Tax=Nocardiopsis dassonvillei TaxID=2014 RepID=UPI00102ACCAB|nr:sulfotransferase domain-containing protein [Nocardiopsis dassonvillei]MCP3014372.1 sulfotransferase domain-containing protein [Nocardiopsis dassonvillei]